jgi:class 3 adenylate cyclase
MMNTPLTSFDASANIWAWRHDDAFEQQSITGLHQAGKTILPYATLLCLGYLALDFASAPSDVWTITLVLRLLMVGYLAFCSVFLFLTPPGKWTTLVCASAPLFCSLVVIGMTLLWSPGENLYGSGIVVPMTAYVILTRKPIHTLLGVLLICLAYPLSNLAYHAIPAAAYTAFASHNLILCGTCLLIVIVSVKLHQLRWQAFCQQQQLSLERDKIAHLAAGLEVRVTERTQQLQKSNQVFSRFVPAEFLKNLGYNDISQVKLGEARQSEMTVVFADLENFTLLNEVLGAQQTMALMNKVLARLGPCVRKHGGFVDKFIGDSTLALFPGTPQQALLAVQEMCLALQDIDFAGKIKSKMAIGIGMHTGSVLLGTLGEAERFEATAMGDTVNVSAGIKGLARVLGAQVLLTGAVYDALTPEEKDNCRWVGAFTLKGRMQAVQVYECFANQNLAQIPIMRDTRGVFENALRDYFAGNAAAAHALLEAIAEDCVWDKPLQFWLKRSANDVRMGQVPSGSLKYF